MKKIIFLIQGFVLWATSMALAQEKLTADTTRANNMVAVPGLQWSRAMKDGKAVYYLYDPKINKYYPIYTSQLANQIFLGKNEAAQVYLHKTGTKSETVDGTKTFKDPVRYSIARPLYGLDMLYKQKADSLYAPKGSTESVTGTPNRIAQYNSAGSLESSSTTTSELNFLSGVNSNVQGQLDSKLTKFQADNNYAQLSKSNFFTSNNFFSGSALQLRGTDATSLSTNPNSTAITFGGTYWHPSYGYQGSHFFSMYSKNGDSFASDTTKLPQLYIDGPFGHMVGLAPRSANWGWRIYSNNYGSDGFPRSWYGEQNASKLTANRIYQLPDKSGTIALLSDIPPSGGSGGSGSFVGTPGKVPQLNSSTGNLESSVVTNTELSTLSGMTGNIQGQLNNKQSMLNGIGFIKANGTSITYDTTQYQPRITKTGIPYIMPDGSVINMQMAYGVVGYTLAVRDQFGNAGFNDLSATRFKVPGGTSSQYLMADGSLSTGANGINGQPLEDQRLSTGNSPTFSNLTLNGALSVQAPITSGGQTANLDPAAGVNLDDLKTGKMMTGWNRTGFEGEADFISGRLPAIANNPFRGGFAFYDYDAAGNQKMLMRLQGNTGNLGIGTTYPDQALTVNGTVHAKEVLVDQNVFPDYVFAKEYKLRQLKDVKVFIDQHHHLPDMPSEKEVVSNGLKIGEVTNILTKKVEELTLYLIEKEKQLSVQQARIDKLEKLLNKY